jgi:hypothetical protein
MVLLFEMAVGNINAETSASVPCADDRQRGGVGHSFGMAGAKVACGVARARQRGAQGARSNCCCGTKVAGSAAGLFTIYSSPTTKMTAAKTIASITFIKSPLSSYIVPRTETSDRFSQNRTLIRRIKLRAVAQLHFVPLTGVKYLKEVEAGLIEATALNVEYHPALKA